MADEATARMPSAAWAQGSRAAGSEELAKGLLLMRASTLKMIRLQLAMERRDRREALEAVDDLVILDRRIGAFLDDLPISSAPLAAARDEVEAQGEALARERLSLAAGIAGPLLASRPGWSEPAPSATRVGEPDELPVLELTEPLPAAELRRFAARFLSGLAAVLLVLTLCLAVVAVFFLRSGGETNPHVPGSTFPGDR